MENREPAILSEEKTIEQESPVEKSAGTDGSTRIKEESIAHPLVDANLLTAGEPTAGGHGANRARVAGTASVPEAGASAASVAASGPDEAPANAALVSELTFETERAAESEQPRKRLKILSDRSSQLGESAATPPDSNFAGRDERAVPASAPGEGRFYGVRFLYGLRGEGRRQGDCTVIFYQSAYQQIVEHLREDVAREHGGLLLGYESAGTNPNELTVYVSKALRAQHTAGSRSRLTFTEDTWAEFANQTESLASTNLRRVGWYHSHPNFGIFLSPYDLDVCSNFQRSTHVALVYDPVRNEGGFFVNGAEGYDPNGPHGFWEYCDVTPDSIVDWTNAELRSGGKVGLGREEDYSEALATGWEDFDGGMMANRNMAGAGAGPQGPRIRRLDGPVNHRASETQDVNQGRRTRRERFLTFLRGCLFGGALTVLAAAIFLNTDVGRNLLSAPSMSRTLAELGESDKRQSKELEEIKRQLAARPATLSSADKAVEEAFSSETNTQESGVDTHPPEGATQGSVGTPPSGTRMRETPRRTGEGARRPPPNRRGNRPRRVVSPGNKPASPAGNQPTPAKTPEARPPATGGKPPRSSGGGTSPPPTRSPDRTPIEL